MPSTELSLAERTSCEYQRLQPELIASLAYRSGVTKAVAFPISGSLFSGLSYAFSTAALHSLSPNAILNPAAALHLSLVSGKMGTSTKLAVLRRLLTSDANNETEIWRVMDQVKHGQRRVVMEVNKADTMAALVRLKRDWAPGMKMTFLGGQEAWMVSASSACTSSCLARRGSCS